VLIYLLVRVVGFVIKHYILYS